MDYKKRKYNIVNYDQIYKDKFLKESQILRAIFGITANKIEHVGSTAVPGLSGKPTIDMLILVEDISVVDSFNTQMESIGYKPLGEYVMQDARLFAKEIKNERLYNVHVFQKNHPHVKEMLLLRDYFLSHPELVLEYSKLKSDLFEKYSTNYGLYRKYKDEWMEELKEKIRKE